MIPISRDTGTDLGRGSFGELGGGDAGRTGEKGWNFKERDQGSEVTLLPECVPVTVGGDDLYDINDVPITLRSERSNSTS